MADYIDRERIYRTLSMENPFGWNNNDLAELFREAESAEVAPVRHGRWEREDDSYGLTIVKCSLCREEWCFEVDCDVADLSYHYCPNCGADMR